MWPLLVAVLLDSATVRRVHVAPAETLTVTVAGEGPSVVLIPGLFGSAYGYRKLIPLLVNSGWRVVVIEPLAVGTSSRPRRADYSLHAQSLRVARAMDLVDADDAIVVGHSVGAAIAYRLALARPDLVRALVSLEGGPAEHAAGPAFRRAMQLAPLVRIGGTGTLRRALRGSLVRASGDAGWVTDEAMREYTAGAAADLSATLLAYMRIAESREPEPLGPRLPSLHCPVWLVLGGAPHSSAPRTDEVERLRRSVPDIRIVTLEGAGHFLHEELPERVLGVVAEASATPIAAGRGR